jgi:hypothetical protein
VPRGKDEDEEKDKIRYEKRKMRYEKRREGNDVRRRQKHERRDKNTGGAQGQCSAPQRPTQTVLPARAAVHESSIRSLRVDGASHDNAGHEHRTIRAA